MIGYQPHLRAWRQPQPKPGEYIVDIQWWDGECITQSFKSRSAANHLAEKMCEGVSDKHLIMIRSVAVYYRRPEEGKRG